MVVAVVPSPPRGICIVETAADERQGVFFIGASRFLLLQSLILALAAGQLVVAGSASATEATALDLGTLGGTNSRAVAVNDVGQVTGDSETKAGAIHAFRVTKNRMRDLGTLGGRESHAVAINSSGDVAGYAQTSAGDWRAVLWPAHGKVVNLGTLGGAYSAAADLSDSRHVVGTAERSSGVRVAFRWTSSGGMQDLGTLGGATSAATSVNALGQVAGDSQMADGTMHAFAWDTSGMQDLGTLGGYNSRAVAINSSGQVAGLSQDQIDVPFMQPFRWSPGAGMEGMSGLTIASVGAINDSGDVVGAMGAGSPYTGPSDAFRWTTSGFVTLQQPGGGDVYPYSNDADDINSSGVTVGSVSTVAGQRGARWAASGQLETLGTLGAGSSYAVAVNSAGAAVGRADTLAGTTHAVIWR
jgi:probable HAF family extracellular repeat protein